MLPYARLRRSVVGRPVKSITNGTAGSDGHVPSSSRDVGSSSQNQGSGGRVNAVTSTTLIIAT
ncbi:hypothetical protein GCM10009848_09360 [Micromonospora lupini]